jgi:hypothetical protein
MASAVKRFMVWAATSEKAPMKRIRTTHGKRASASWIALEDTGDAGNEQTICQALGDLTD